jgi:hypothetical protein
MSGGAFTDRSREAVERLQARCVFKPLAIDELRAVVARAIADADSSNVTGSPW